MLRDDEPEHPQGGGWRAVADGCTGCGACVRQCRFLQQVGDPGLVARRFDPSRAADQTLPFGCSLCGLCAGLCPEGLDPSRAFLEQRRAVVRLGGGELDQHRVLREYQRRGTSPRYSYYSLPAGCDTVWFPGCALAGSRPQVVMDLYRHLGSAIPGLGVILDCCAKPSHDLGQDQQFLPLFGEMREYLLSRGVRRVLTACPGCNKVFREYGEGLRAHTVYQALEEVGLPAGGRGQGTVAVHDPCVARFDTRLQQAVRGVLHRAGLTVEELPSSGRRTLCCGEGGAVGSLAPGLARSWGRRRGEQAAGRSLITYCAGCERQLSGHAQVGHLLDLLFRPAGSRGVASGALGLRAYANRLLLKRRLQRAAGERVTRERPAGAGPPRSRLQRWHPLALVEALVAAILAVV